MKARSKGGMLVLNLKVDGRTKQGRACKEWLQNTADVLEEGVNHNIAFGWGTKVVKDSK